MYSGSGGGDGDYYRSGWGSSDQYSERSERERVPSRYRSSRPVRRRSSRGGPSPGHRSSGGSSRYISPSPGPSYSRHCGSSRDSRIPHSADRHDKCWSRDQRERSAASIPEKQSPKATADYEDIEAKQGKEDNRNVLQRMEMAIADGPLDALKRCVKDGIKVKVWTTNHKEVRGICTGFVVAFDKLWNIVIKDVDEVYLKPCNSKSPFLLKLTPGESDAIPEMAPRAPKEKKKKPEGDSSMDAEKAARDTENEEGTKPELQPGDPPAVKPKKKRRRKKRNTPKILKRHLTKVFIRGNNVVMVALPTDSDVKPEQSEEDKAATAESYKG